MVLLTICDIIWAIIMSFVWNHNDKGTRSDYWDSLAWMHSMIYWFGIFELLFKVGLIAYLSVDFKKIAPISELTNLNYKDNTQKPSSDPNNL